MTKIGFVNSEDENMHAHARAYTLQVSCVGIKCIPDRAARSRGRTFRMLITSLTTYD